MTRDTRKGYGKPHIYFNGTFYMCRQVMEFGKLYVGEGDTPYKAFFDMQSWKLGKRHA